MQALSRLEELKQEPASASAPPMDDILAQLEQLPTPSKTNPSFSGKGNNKGTSHTFPRGRRLLTQSLAKFSDVWHIYTCFSVCCMCICTCRSSHKFLGC